MQFLKKHCTKHCTFEVIAGKPESNSTLNSNEQFEDQPGSPQLILLTEDESICNGTCPAHCNGKLFFAKKTLATGNTGRIAQCNCRVCVAGRTQAALRERQGTACNVRRPYCTCSVCAPAAPHTQCSCKARLSQQTYAAPLVGTTTCGCKVSAPSKCKCGASQVEPLPCSFKVSEPELLSYPYGYPYPQYGATNAYNYPANGYTTWNQGPGNGDIVLQIGRTRIILSSGGRSVNS